MQYRTGLKDVIRRGVAPDHMDPVQGEGEGRPGGLPSAAHPRHISSAGLPQAEMGDKPAVKPGRFVAVGDFAPQGQVQRFERLGRLGGQVEGGAEGAAHEKAEALQAQLERQHQAAGTG